MCHPLPPPAVASMAMGTDQSTAYSLVPTVTALFSPWAVIHRDRSLLRVREEFVVPGPSLGSSAGTTDGGAHRCDPLGSQTELFSLFQVAQLPAHLAG